MDMNSLAFQAVQLMPAGRGTPAQSGILIDSNEQGIFFLVSDEPPEYRYYPWSSVEYIAIDEETFNKAHVKSRTPPASQGGDDEAE
jgi:hypothetical protein